jgi:hypothetical protein
MTKTPTRKKAKDEPVETVALHAQRGDNDHLVGVWNLHVLIVPDGRFWFAQGLEIDYAVQGASVQDAKKQFETGLTATIHHNLRIFGHIENLLQVAPNDVWKDLWKTSKAKHKTLSQVSIHEIVPEVLLDPAGVLPFRAIEYTEVQ